MSKISQAAYEIVKPFADSLGLYVVEVKYEKRFDGYHLTVVIDKEGGVNITDCEDLSRLIDAPLDEADPTNNAPYLLDVSSMGLDRPLTTDYDFKKYMNKEIVVKLYAPQKGGKKEFKGVLSAYDGQSVTIQSDGQEITVDREKAANIVPFIKF